MSDIALSLVVLRSPDIARAAAFYARLGLQFTQHRHGAGPDHFSAVLAGGGVFEIYPLSGATPAFLARVGFKVPSVDLALAGLRDVPESVMTAAHDSEWGRRAVVADPDGNKVELVQA